MSFYAVDSPRTVPHCGAKFTELPCQLSMRLAYLGTAPALKKACSYQQAAGTLSRQVVCLQNDVPASGGGFVTDSCKCSVMKAGLLSL